MKAAEKKTAEVFFMRLKDTHTHAAVWSKICWSICGKKVSDWRRRSTSAVAQDALKFKVRSTQSNGGSVDARRPTSPPSALLISANLTVFTSRRFQGFTSFLYSPRSWKAFSEKIKLTAEWRFEGLHTPTSWRHDNVNNLQQTPLC